MARCRRLNSLNLTWQDLQADHELQAHVIGCRTCAGLVPLRPAEIAALHSSAPGVDDVALRRLRQRLLEDLAAGAAPVPVERRTSRYRLVVALGLVVGAASVAIAFWSTSPVRVTAPRFLATVIPRDSVTARWSQRVLAGTEEINLEKGTFRVKVKDHPADRHVVFRVPDGEIEDLGTVFDVVVVSGHTRRVEVVSGQVALRLRDASPVSLSSGALWNQSADVISPMTPAKLSLPLPHAPVVEHRSRPSPPISLPPPRSPAQPGVLSASEDVAYLHVVQLVRASRMTEARIAATDYLRRFPRGFRSDEMRKLVNQ